MFHTICLIRYSGSLYKSEVKLGTDNWKDIFIFMPRLHENNVTLVDMKPLGVHFALTILDNHQRFKKASMDYSSLECFIFAQKLNSRKV